MLVPPPHVRTIEFPIKLTSAVFVAVELLNVMVLSAVVSPTFMLHTACVELLLYPVNDIERMMALAGISEPDKVKVPPLKVLFEDPN